MNNFPLSALNVSDDIKKEFSIDSEGKGKVTQRGAARLLGVTDKLVRPPLAVTLTQELHNAGFKGESFEDGITDVEFAVAYAYPPSFQALVTLYRSNWSVPSLDAISDNRAR